MSSGPNRSALSTVTIYLVVGGLWIVFSDRLLRTFAGNDATIVTQLQTYKGWFFIAVTGAMLYVLVSRGVNRARQVERETREERGRLEEQVRQAQKLEAIGQLAGGIAHDFNNLLTAIIGYAELAQGVLPPGQLRADLEQIRKAGERASSLTRQLLAFSRQQILQPRVVDVNAIVADLGKMLQRVIGEDVRLTTDLGSDIGKVLADPGQIEQVLLNLAVNSRDAMPEGGELRIATSAATVTDDPTPRQAAIPPGSYVAISVSDTGQGMDAATQAKAFEPFFTTKPVGKGTGLGLATVYGIVKQSNGYVWIESAPGKGATFHIHLPRVEETGAVEKPAAPAAGQTEGGERILLVEDDAQVRELVREMLEPLGYTVVPAVNGEHALALVNGSDFVERRVDLLLTDVVMPGIDGRRIAERMRELWPDTRVLFMSGYTTDGSVQRGIADQSAAFIQKPFSGQMLARKVREVLDGRLTA